MNLKKVLTPGSVKIGLPATTKAQVIEQLVDIIVTNGHQLDRAALLQAVGEREAQMSTGMKNGIAIPHGKTDAVSQLHAAIAISAAPVDFQSLDKQPASIFVMTISPASRTGPHLQFLAEISGLLNRPELRERILRAASEAELLALFLEGHN